MWKVFFVYSIPNFSKTSRYCSSMTLSPLAQPWQAVFVSSIRLRAFGCMWRLWRFRLLREEERKRGKSLLQNKVRWQDSKNSKYGRRPECWRMRFIKLFDRQTTSGLGIRFREPLFPSWTTLQKDMSIDRMLKGDIFSIFRRLLLEKFGQWYI